MKKMILLSGMLLFTFLLHAQSDKYTSSMKALISRVDSIRTNHDGVEIANNFERIGKAEKDKWLPYYYAAYALLIQTMSQEDLSSRDALTDRASDFIKQAETILGKENSETVTLKSLAATAYLTADPQSRFMTYGTEANQLSEQAKAMDTTNPRPVLLQAQMTFYTPEQFGGGKDAAKPALEKADSLYSNFKPESDLSPSWGKLEIAYFLSQYK